VIALVAILSYGLLIPANQGRNHRRKILLLHIPALSDTCVNPRRDFFIHIRNFLLAEGNAAVKIFRSSDKRFLDQDFSRAKIVAKQLSRFLSSTGYD
jgi:hypothetical protein